MQMITIQYTKCWTIAMNNLKLFLKHIVKSKLLLVGIAIYLLFNISALAPSHFMDFFFFGSSVHHCCQGLDFYQVPNGMYAFLHGGNLSGNLTKGISQYSQNYLSNYNVYHPLLTIVVGGFFILFNPDFSFYLFMVIKFFITSCVLFYIFKNFKENKYLNFAMFIFLINFSQYNDIKISQYQFFLNIFLLLLLINLVKNREILEGGILFFITLIVKPIGLLWTPVLLIRKKFTILLSGFGLFIISTLTFNLLGVGHYYTDNLLYHILNPIETHGIDFMSLDALLRNGVNASAQAVSFIKFLFLGIIYLLSFNKQTHILKLFFLLTTYFLYFYDLLFQYDFSILGPVLCLCLLVLPEFQTKIARLLITLISFPTVFFILRILNFGITKSATLGIDPTLSSWKIVSFFQLLPIILLTVIVLLPEIKSISEKEYVLI